MWESCVIRTGGTVRTMLCVNSAHTSQCEKVNIQRCFFGHWKYSCDKLCLSYTFTITIVNKKVLQKELQASEQLTKRCRWLSGRAHPSVTSQDYYYYNVVVLVVVHMYCTFMYVQCRVNGCSGGYAITRAEFAMPELVPELWHALARPVP